MKTKLLCMAAAIVLVAASCGDGQRKPHQSGGPKLTDEVTIKTTPVKDQGRGPLCWAYAMLATIESERLMIGDSVNLSPEYYGRMMLQDEARRYYFSRRRGNISLRGTSAMLLNMMQSYGAMPFDSYNSRHSINYNVLARTAQQMADASTSLEAMDGRIGSMLDREMGFLPQMVFMLGAEYTPRQFAESVSLPGEYLSLTSFSHHPFGRKFVLEVPDNQLRDSFINVPIDTLMAHVVSALRHGHAVCWEGDVSEPGFSFAQGYAALPKSVGPVDQNLRQRHFERHATTDDHCMELCGLARDRQGRLWFKAKNSWGKDNPYGGFMYLSYNYVKLKTIAIYMSREAWQGG